eukprot:3357228-Rhodomonas_salina.1
MESVETSHAEVSSKKDDDVSTRSEETSASTVDGATEKSTGEADDGGPLDGQSSAAAERRNSEDRKRLEVKQSRIQVNFASSVCAPCNRHGVDSARGGVPGGRGGAFHSCTVQERGSCVLLRISHDNSHTRRNPFG